MELSLRASSATTVTAVPSAVPSDVPSALLETLFTAAASTLVEMLRGVPSAAVPVVAIVIVRVIEPAAAARVISAGSTLY